MMSWFLRGIGGVVNVSRNTTRRKLKLRLGSIRQLITRCFLSAPVPLPIGNIPTDDEDPIFERAEEESWLCSFLRELSEDAEFLVGAVLEAPGELKNIVKESAPKSTQKRLRRYMQSEMQWDVERIERTWEEVKSWL